MEITFGIKVVFKNLHSGLTVGITLFQNNVSSFSLHILAGVYPDGDNLKEEHRTLWHDTYVQNLKFASQRVALVCES